MCSDKGQDIVEYAVMATLLLVIMIATVKIIGGNKLKKLTKEIEVWEKGARPQIG